MARRQATRIGPDRPPKEDLGSTRRTRAGQTVGLTRLAILALTLLALALRSWHLSFQSLWWDEGVSVYLAGAGVRALTVAKDFAVDLHAPGYYLLLAAWRLLLGPSVFSVRLLSTFCGVLTVPLVYVLARTVWPHPPPLSTAGGEGETGLPSPPAVERGRGGEAAFVAALLAAMSPVDVYYSQEARMYPLLPLLGALSLLATTKVLARGYRRDWLLWILANLAGWYVYYYLALLTIAEALVLLVVAARRRQLPPWAASQALLLLGYVPWLAVIAGRFSSAQFALPPDTAVYPTSLGYLLDNWQDFTVGFSTPPGASVLLALWALAMLAGGLALARRRPTLLALLLTAALVPLAGAGALLLARPFFYPRFILFVAVAIWVLVGGGIEASRRFLPLGLVVLAVMLAGNAWTWYDERTTPRTGYATDDYRTIFSTLASNARPGDPVVGGYPWQAGYVAAYLWRNALQARYRPGPLDVAALPQIAAPTGRVWLYDYVPDGHFPADALSKLRASRAQVLVVDQYGDSRATLLGYGAPSPAAGPPRATLGGEIGLLSAEFGAPRPLRPGDHVSITLRWQALSVPRAAYTVFVHLLGPDRKVWGQKDTPPLDGAAPTDSWDAGEVVVDRYEIPLAPNAPAGRFEVEVGMYRPENVQRLTVAPAQADNRIVIATPTVER